MPRQIAIDTILSDNDFQKFVINSKIRNEIVFFLWCLPRLFLSTVLDPL